MELGSFQEFIQDLMHEGQKENELSSYLEGMVPNAGHRTGSIGNLKEDICRMKIFT